jgi:F-type H+-transporting ATPase subunit b
MLAVNDFLIPNGTFIAELIAFVLVVVVIARYVLPPVNKAMDERQATIRAGLEDAERGRELLASAETERERILAEARAEARAIVEQAARVGEEARQEIVAKGEEERERLLTRARAELEREASQLVEETRRHLVELVMSVAERVVEAELSPERHRALIEEAARALADGRRPAAGAVAER